MAADSLDDIFGSSPPHPEQPLPQAHSNPTVEPSELPSLRRQHVTAGYRDGISASKAEHVQHGFDAGFPVGAQLGMRAGTIIGILEGVLRGYESSPTTVKKPGQKSTPSTPASKEADEAKKAKREEIFRLYKQAVKELNVQAVFAGVDGGALQGQGSEEKPETQLLKKGDKVLAAWEKKVPVAAWEEHIMDVLEAKSDDGKGNGKAGEDEKGQRA
ncbi:Yae1 family protein [Aspergillus mulundensis]|uniref:Protein YAE1 n=1 Tax=Aspergillus mulundensis TaxID=1810919 RepID=A0A3D8SJ28_9EURO|nr:hypothetical protein DSM5745_02914 [Aspergillus mulundensis]RDW86272.1 hypothetical protein DSM5745_02914 [Aspergillus mulundensis]